MKLLGYIFLVVCLYLFIYSPPLQLLPFGLIKLLIPIAYLYLIRNKLFSKMVILYSKEITLLFVITLYCFFRSAFSINQDFTFFYDALFLIIEVFPISFFLVNLILKSRKFQFNSTEDKLFLPFIVVAGVASAISFFLIVNPQFATIMNTSILRSGEIGYVSTYRSFGFASSLLYSYSIVQGIAAAILLYKAKDLPVKSYPYYVIVFVLLIISILFNARVGLIPIFIMIFYQAVVKRNYKIVIVSLCLLPILYFFLLDSSFSSLFSENLSWSLGFFTQTQDFLNGSSNNTTYDTLFKDMFFLPPDLNDYIFGIGKDIFTDGSKNSDMGYVRQIFYGGFVYLIMLLSFIGLMFKRVKRINRFEWFGFLFLICIIVCEVKGLFISNHSAFRVLILFYVGIIYANSLNKSGVIKHRYE